MAGTKNQTESHLTFACESELISGSSILNSVEGISIESLVDGSTCYVRTSTLSFRWYEDSIAVPAPGAVILPAELTVGEPGRWILISGGGGGGGVDSVAGTGGITVAPGTGNVVVSGAALYARDGSNGPMTAVVDFGGFAGQNLANPTNPQDAATKFYVDTLKSVGLNKLNRSNGAGGWLDTGFTVTGGQLTELEVLSTFTVSVLNPGQLTFTGQSTVDFNHAPGGEFKIDGIDIFRTIHATNGVGLYVDDVTAGTRADGLFLAWDETNGRNVYAAASSSSPTLQSITAAGPTAVTDTMLTIALVNFAGAAAVVLPAHAAGKIVHVKDASGLAGVNNITITPTAGLIDGAASQVIGTNSGSLQFVSDGTNWFIL